MQQEEGRRMLLAVFGDIHGNFPAFEAVMKHIDGRGIQTIVNAGDSVAGFWWPNEVIEHLRMRRIYSVQGTMDRRAVLFQRGPIKTRTKLSEEVTRDIEWTHYHCRSDNLEFLRALPKRRMFAVEGFSVFVCHGSPTSQDDGLHDSDPDRAFKRQREFANTHIIISGQTHERFCRTVDDTLFVNPGSIGYDAQGLGTAHYAVIDTDVRPFSVEFVPVFYDASIIEERRAAVRQTHSNRRKAL